MQIANFSYINKQWSVTQFPDLDSADTLVLAFCAPEYFDNTHPFHSLKKAYPQAIIAGCSTGGEIFNTELNDNSIAVVVSKLQKSTIKIACASISDTTSSYETGKKLASDLNQSGLKTIFILSDGIQVNGSTLVEGLKEHLPHDVIVTGGLAGDGSNFEKTWVLIDDKPTMNHIIAIGFYGDNIQVGYGCKGGWDIFGPQRLITRSTGNILYEIDGLPALDVYQKYLGEKAKELPSSGLLFPLAIKENRSSKQEVVRTILAINEDEQSLTFAGNIPEGWYGQLMKANFDRLIEGASVAGLMAVKTLGSNTHSLNLAISCIGRRLVLGQRTEEELEATLENLGNNIKLTGFYSYGEISPSGLKGCDLHNQTMTITCISENPA